MRQTQHKAELKPHLQGEVGILYYYATHMAHFSISDIHTRARRVMRVYLYYISISMLGKESIRLDIFSRQFNFVCIGV